MPSVKTGMHGSGERLRVSSGHGCRLTSLPTTSGGRSTEPVSDMAADTSGRVTVALTGAVADVRLNRPEKRNALDPAMFEALVAASGRLRFQQGLRTVVLSGAGPDFCAGLDFASFQAMRAGERLAGVRGGVGPHPGHDRYPAAARAGRPGRCQGAGRTWPGCRRRPGQSAVRPSAAHRTRAPAGPAPLPLLGAVLPGCAQLPRRRRTSAPWQPLFKSAAGRACLRGRDMGCRLSVARARWRAATASAGRRR